MTSTLDESYSKWDNLDFDELLRDEDKGCARVYLMLERPNSAKFLEAAMSRFVSLDIAEEKVADVSLLALILADYHLLELNTLAHTFDFCVVKGSPTVVKDGKWYTPPHTSCYNIEQATDESRELVSRGSLKQAMKRPA